jgi:ParB-like chromosome segregation protein Spo0J
MVDVPQYPPLKSLHPDSSLNAAKLEKMHRVSTEALLASLLPGLEDCLKTRPDGTILDGHHRIRILRERGVDVDNLPRDIVVKDHD